MNSTPLVGAAPWRFKR